jgi:murein DD-endopeptidase MepM/ murein hydrolase activator NlpD
MGWADRWMRRFFVMALLVAMGASTSWLAAPVASRGWHAAARVVERAVAAVEPARTAVGANDAGSGAQGSPGNTGSAAAGADQNTGADAGPGGVEPGASNGQTPAIVIPSADGYVWPLANARITTYFAPSASGSMILAGVPVHNGLDLARPCGTPILAAHAATIVYAGRRADPYLGVNGSVQPYYDELVRRKLTDLALPIEVITDDGNGLIGVYAHLRVASVKAGQSVRAGETIGLEGRTGNATGCHLHYSLYLANGPWVPVAPLLIEKWHYPTFMRLRIDPLLVLPADSPDAGRPRAGLFPPADPPHYVAPLPEIALHPWD